MAGLMNQESGSTGDSNVSPEEQAEYTAFVTNGMKLMYAPDGLPQLIESMKGDGSPVEGLANALVSVVTRLEDSAEKQGQQISGDVKFHGSIELMEQMVSLAKEAGIQKLSDKEIESALFMAMDTYRVNRQQQGKLPEEELQGEMQELMRAEQQGTLSEMVPGIEEYAKRATKPEKTARRA